MIGPELLVVLVATVGGLAALAPDWPTSRMDVTGLAAMLAVLAFAGTVVAAGGRRGAVPPAASARAEEAST